MTTGGPIRRLENGHLHGFLCLSQGLEIADIKGESHGGDACWADGRPKRPLPPVQRAGSKRPQGTMTPEDGVGVKSQDGRDRQEGHTSGQTHTTRLVMGPKTVAGVCVCVSVCVRVCPCACVNIEAKHLLKMTAL